MVLIKGKSGIFYFFDAWANVCFSLKDEGNKLEKSISNILTDKNNYPYDGTYIANDKKFNLKCYLPYLGNGYYNVAKISSAYINRNNDFYKGIQAYVMQSELTKEYVSELLGNEYFNSDLIDNYYRLYTEQVPLPSELYAFYCEYKK